MGWMTEESIPDRAKKLSLHNVHTGSGIHPAFSPLATGGIEQLI
jgi:hypothetical protein